MKTFLHQNINIIKDKKREGGGEEGWSTSEQTEEACSDTVIYNKKHTFGLCPLSQQSAPKTPGIAQVMVTIKVKGVSVVIHKDRSSRTCISVNGLLQSPKDGDSGQGKHTEKRVGTPTSGGKRVWRLS